MGRVMERKALSDGHKLRSIRPTSSPTLALINPTVTSHGAHFTSLHFTDVATLRSHGISISNQVKCFMDWRTLTVGLLV